ncbi:hypothetical protein FBUS_08108, partial [Fasciolopsis buskii]
FCVKRVLSDPHKLQPTEGSWLTGKINESLCRTCLFSTVPTTEELQVTTTAFWLICGPPGFNEAAMEGDFFAYTVKIYDGTSIRPNLYHSPVACSGLERFRVQRLMAPMLAVHIQCYRV